MVAILVMTTWPFTLGCEWATTAVPVLERLSTPAAVAARLWVLGVSRRSNPSRPARNARERFADMLRVLSL